VLDILSATYYLDLLETPIEYERETHAMILREYGEKRTDRWRHG